MNKIIEIKNFIGIRCYELFLWGIATSLSCFVIETGFIYIIQLFLFKVGILKESNSFILEYDHLSLYYICFIFIFYSLIRSIILSVKGYLICMTGQYFKTFQREKFSKFSLQHPGEIKNNSIIEVFSERITAAAVTLEQVNNLLISVIMSTFFLAYSFYKTPLETLIGITILVVLILPLQLLNKYVSEFGKTSVSEWKDINTNLLNGLHNGALLKIYQLNKSWFQEVSQKLNNYVSIYSKYYQLASIRTNMPLFLGMTTLVGTSLFSKHYTTTPSEDLLIFFYIFVRFSQNISAANNSSTNVRMNLPGLLRIQDLNKVIDGKSTDWMKDDSTAVIKKTVDLNLKLKDVSFSYNSEVEVLKDINLNLKANEMLLIKGPSGSGKSTILGLILNQLDPNNGSIEFNHINIRQIPLKYASMLAYVGPDSKILPASLRDNLQFANPNTITDQEIWDALEVVQLAKFVKKLPLQLSEILTDKVEISTGQQQRFSLARAILRKPSVLILDEATANLDLETEEEFIKSLLATAHDKIVITVSHRDTFDKYATSRIDL
jgi:ABC-type bacteriocin/lantibiotic exporter with double-glycine peptidase domain